MSSFSTTGLLFFCALLGSAFSYKCISCISKNSTECEESVIDCVGSRCMTGSEYYHNGDQTYNIIFKGCANESLCDAVGSVTQDPDVKIRTYAKCCSGDNCNNDKFQLPEEDSTPNGVKCPSSYCKGTTEECKSDKEIECTGSEKQCYDYRGRIMNPDGSVDDYSSKGCINKPGCMHNFNCLIKVEEIKRTLLKC
ncbi:phospholipase A2 inhibitor and Ly6/PLAUR domain-containing protein-like [Hyla sarda]|uniref:phospholipase A2 inhibitor and Ly6/PLAUR domain-containing protein-like n=1 Tax=Hyla sarda TaxID=327740 RepID=UPI0024C44A04|nr:phospholipase A2 inhibitor and Ly6/PLAUR domain-containing protein-like [Hyla sarda]